MGIIRTVVVAIGISLLLSSCASMEVQPDSGRNDSGSSLGDYDPYLDAYLTF